MSKRQPLKVMLDVMNNFMDEAERLIAFDEPREKIVSELARAGFWADRAANYCHVKFSVVGVKNVDAEGAQPEYQSGLDRNAAVNDVVEAARIYQEIMTKTDSETLISSAARARSEFIDSDIPTLRDNGEAAIAESLRKYNDSQEDDQADHS